MKLDSTFEMRHMQFKDLEPGDVFRIDSSILMKTEDFSDTVDEWEVNAVYLESGELAYIRDFEHVNVCNVKLTLE